ncbi:MAG: cytochrome ubiquinol oxidase subunit I [Micavibrio sp.]|nr:cytochrome ubiquinol oxidase subunit I [Micavibrio sp.]|tara:strand:+ start:480 stop:1868 length:1389 start_codon:yes stop_codon:yes gene_type:complete
MFITDLDPVLLARIQFAFTVSFHIVFPAFTIGLASWLAVVEGLWLKTGNNTYKDIYKFWVKIFAVCFGMGVVSGVVMSYQFGTNWSVFSDQAGNVIGPLLAYEVLTAFFLEASFLGIMLFGWGRVSKGMHFASTIIVAIGTLFSAFWILSANSWMQTPQGFEIGADGLLYPTNWIEIIFNPSFPYRFFHMVTAAYLTTAFVVGGVGSWYLWRGEYMRHARIMVGMAMIMAVFVAPAQLLIGHAHGENTLHYQPVKVAAMEGNWERGGNKPLYLFGWPNMETETTDYGITIPDGASWVLTGKADGEIPGLKDVPPEDRPPVAIVFWSFRIMVGLGMAMILTGVFAIVLYATKRLYDSRPFQLWCMAMTPSGFIALLAGWFVTEVGRQPYTAYGVIRTSESVSPVLGEHVALSLLAFIVVYTALFGAATYYIIKLIRKGPAIIDEGETYYGHSMEASATKKGNE